MSLHAGVFSAAIEQMDRKRRSAEYFNNPVLWAKDHLGIQLWSKQAEVAMSVVTDKNVVVKAGHEVGKDMPLDTPIPTPTGWSTIGDLKVGDFVLDEQGKPARVVAKSEIFNNELFEVTFSDGAKAITSGTHEWNTIDFRAAKSARRSTAGVTDWRNEWDRSETRTTAQIAATLEYSNGGDGSRNHSIPINCALDLPDADLLIEPYILGAWLGDGTSVRPEMSVGPESMYVVDEFAKLGVTLTSMTGKYVFAFTKQGYVQKLRALGVLGAKHIPDVYLRASIAQRKELLRGLMDTDGFSCHDALCGIDLMNKELADGVAELIRSLGIRASKTTTRTHLNGVDVGPRYRIVFHPDFSPFTTGQYKDDSWAPKANSSAKRTARTIVSVTPVPTVPTQCIQVDSPRNLYLATEWMIPTHNSFLAGVLICWWVDTRWDLPGGCFVVSTAPSSKQINAIVWREVRKFWQLSQQRFEAGLIDHALPGYITSMAHWRLDSGIELGYGAKPPEHKEDTMSGIHARYVLAVGDEAVGLTESLIDDLGNITSNATSRRFLILNPTNPLSYVAKIFKNAITSWSKHTITVFDSPNFHGGEGLPIEVLETLVDQSYVDDKLAEWGGVYVDEKTGQKSSTSPKYISRVLGEFAFDMGPTIISVEDMAIGIDTDIPVDQEARPVLGVDVSRSEFGDMNTVYANTGGRLRFIDSWNEKNAMRTAERIHEHALSTGATEVRIDGAGLGGPIVDRVAELSGGRYFVISMLGGAASPDRSKWYNTRAFWYSEFGEMLRSGRIDIDPDDDRLQEEMLGIEYKQQTHGLGAILIESKDDMRKRGVGSPDYADAAVYAMADTSPLLQNPLGHLEKGDIVRQDPWEMLALSRGGENYPI